MKTKEVSVSVLERLHKLESEQLKGDMDVEVCIDIIERKGAIYNQLKGEGKGVSALIPKGDAALEEAVKDMEDDK